MEEGGSEKKAVKRGDMKGERKVRKLKLKYTCNYSRKHHHNIAREIESLRGGGKESEEGKEGEERGESHTMLLT